MGEVFFRCWRDVQDVPQKQKKKIEKKITAGIRECSEGGGVVDFIPIWVGLEELSLPLRKVQSTFVVSLLCDLRSCID